MGSPRIGGDSAKSFLKFVAGDTTMSILKIVGGVILMSISNIFTSRHRSGAEDAHCRCCAWRVLRQTEGTHADHELEG